MPPTRLLALDVGAARIGVATADTGVRIAVPQAAISVDGSEIATIMGLQAEHNAATIVVGYPRNMSGEATAQTAEVVAFAERLRAAGAVVVYQDESLTSVAAENFLKQSGKRYSRGDIDSHAAVVILTDYLEAHYA
jgi:putative holliday junction resolvase